MEIPRFRDDPCVARVAVAAGVVTVIGAFVVSNDAPYVFDGLTSRALPVVIICVLSGGTALALLLRHAHLFERGPEFGQRLGSTSSAPKWHNSVFMRRRSGNPEGSPDAAVEIALGRRPFGAPRSTGRSQAPAGISPPLSFAIHRD